MAGKLGCDKDDHIWNREEPQPIAIPLPGYQPQHDTETSQNDYGFVGRNQLIEELRTILNETRNTRGCYLISGYRGSGKTTLINKVLALHSGSMTHPGWIPWVNDRKSTFHRKLKRLIRRGRVKLYWISKHERGIQSLKLFFYSLTSCLYNFRQKFSIFRNSRLIFVRVNLGYDKILEPREVLFNTTTLLYHELKRKNHPFKYYLIVIVAVLAYVVPLESDFLKGIYIEIGKWLTTLTGYTNILTITPDKWISLFLIVGVFYILWTYYFPTYSRVLHRLRRLNKRMASTLETNSGVKNSGFVFGRKEVMPALDVRQIENELLTILEECRKVWCISFRPNIVFVFDELDKIASQKSNNTNESELQTSVEYDLYERKQKVDSLLGALKNFITHGRARFFFIAGREMLDSYQAERGSTSSLYESLFNRTFEVPSLLTDPSDHNKHRMHSLIEVYVCRMILDKDIAISLWLQHANLYQNEDPCWEDDLHRKLQYSPFCLRTYYHYLSTIPDIKGCEARRIVLGLRNFIQFLTLHSWGNPKRAISLFDHFTKPKENVDWRQINNLKKYNLPHENVINVLQFGLIDQQRILLSSNLYTQLYHSLGRQLSNSGDKLAVSTMAAFQYILKFHRHPFSRHHLERMSETLNVYRSPELNMIIDTIISKVFHYHIRRIRNSHHRYRFNGDFEQELRYISRISDIESAAFNFSLDASAPIKAHYQHQLNELNNNTKTGMTNGRNEVETYNACMTIGDLYALEQSHEQALIYYQRAVDVIDQSTKKRRIRFAHFSVEALLRLGDIYEQRQRYDQAASVYLQARSIVKTLKTSAKGDYRDALNNCDSKWDVFRQPFWAYWYLQLKRSPVSMRKCLPPKGEYPFVRADDAISHYRAGQLAFFYGCHYTAVDSFIKAIELSGVKQASTEKTAYLGAYAYLHLGENIFAGMMCYLLKNCKLNSIGTLDKLLEKTVYLGEEVYEKISRFESVNCLGDLENHYLASKNGHIKKLGKIHNEKTFLNSICLFETIAMMVYAAKMMTKRGLHYHASLAYMKILSVWGMITETLSVLIEVGSHLDAPGVTNKSCVELGKKIGILLHRSDKWISEIRLNASENITYFSGGGYSRFQWRWKTRDVVNPLREKSNAIRNEDDKSELSNMLTSEWDDITKHIFSKGRRHYVLSSDAEIGTELQKTIRLLFPGDLSNHKKIREWAKKLSISKKGGERMLDEPIFMQRSMTGQKLIYLSMWEYMAKVSFCKGSKPLKIQPETMVPHSTRSLLFSHWLAGRRYLRWSVLDEVEKKDCDREKLYDHAAAAAHNFYRSIYYIRQLTGNDQDLIFPSPSMVLCNLWQLLHALVKFELNLKSDHSYDTVVEYVKGELSESKLRNNSTPAIYFDLNNVQRQTLDLLHDVEQLQDITNRARSDAIRTRYYLADDYEDPRFHLDWTLSQMYGIAAAFQRRYVELVGSELRKSHR